MSTSLAANRTESVAFRTKGQHFRIIRSEIIVSFFHQSDGKWSTLKNQRRIGQSSRKSVFIHICISKQCVKGTPGYFLHCKFHDYKSAPNKWLKMISWPALSSTSRIKVCTRMPLGEGETRTQVLELGPRDGSLLCSSLI